MQKLNLLPFFFCLTLITTSCNHSKRTGRMHKPAATDEATPAKVQEAEQKIITEQKKTANPSFALADNAQLNAVIETFILQKKIRIKNFEGKDISSADYKLNPNQYFLIFSDSSTIDTFVALNTSITAVDKGTYSDFKISYKLFKVYGDPEEFLGSKLSEPVFSRNIELSADSSSIFKNIPAITGLIQDIEESEQFSKASPNIINFLSDFLVPTAYAGQYKKGYLITGIVFTSISAIAYLTCHKTLGNITLLAGVTLLFLDWLNRPSELGEPVELPNNFPAPIDLDDKVTAKCKTYTETVSPAQFAAYAPHMGAEGHRFYHLFWHGLRNSWHEFSDSEKALVQSIDPKYAKVNYLAAPNFFKRHDQVYEPFKNGAGEDFLLMHRNMVLAVREELSSKNLPCISAWKTTPPPGDPNFPVLPDDDNGTKTKLGYNIMKMLERQYFHNQKWLATQPLTAVGHTLEFSLHGLFHLRFADESSVYKNRPKYTTVNLSNFPVKYSEPANQYLADPYSSHVNPTFWKLHGYVDEVIHHWLVSKGFTSISVSCGATPKCYQWQDTTKAFNFSHQEVMQVLPKFQAYSLANPTKHKTLNSLLEKMEENKIRVYKTITTYPNVMSRTIYTLDTLNVSTNFAMKFADLLIFP